MPLLRDVSWDSFVEIDVCTNVNEGPDESNLHTLDVESCIAVFKLLVIVKAEVNSLAISFPRLVDFSSPLFQENLELFEVMHACKINRLRVQLYCDEESDNGELMVRCLTRCFSEDAAK